MLTVVSENFDPTNRIYCVLWAHVPCDFFNVAPPCIAIDPLHMTSKRPSWGPTSKFPRSTERIIDANSIVYKKFYVHKLYIFHRLFALLFRWEMDYLRRWLENGHSRILIILVCFVNCNNLYIDQRVLLFIYLRQSTIANLASRFQVRPILMTRHH